jgi:hypothetical protein
VEEIEPIGAVLEVLHMVLNVWAALETPDRTCGYQGLVYGLMYASLDMGDPKPNPTWPDLKDALTTTQNSSKELRRQRNVSRTDKAAHGSRT